MKASDSSERSPSALQEPMGIPMSEVEKQSLHGVLEKHLLESSPSRFQCPLDMASGSGTTEGRESFPDFSAPMIGPYRLLEKLGEGGFGEVWLATQESPIRRKVALKIIKPGMDSRAVLARFELEQRTLSLMEHPHIARVVDGGMTTSGRPYFVMEYVAGLPLITYCDQERLDLPARLELFITVCQAVQHAHQKFVIHRDLKPANVLVGLVEGRPFAKVIDFGIAKVLVGSATDPALSTGGDLVLGTPAYMSPEQLFPDGLGLDTKADVYSLGVVLFELLTSRLPFPNATIAGTCRDQLRRAIFKSEAPRMSLVVASLDQVELATIAARRRLEIPQFSRRLRGDLDAIVGKCLEPERTGRYATANAVAMDIQRFLRDEPITAGQPGSWSRLCKCVRRHRSAAWGTAGVVAALIGGLVLCQVQAVRARRAEREQTRLREVADQAQTRAIIERQRAEHNFDMARRTSVGLRALNHIFQGSVNRLLPLAKEADQPDALLAILDEAGRQAKRDLADEPELAAEVFHIVGRNYFHAGRNQQAAEWLQLAHRRLESHSGTNSRILPDLLLDLVAMTKMPPRRGLAFLRQAQSQLDRESPVSVVRLTDIQIGISHQLVLIGDLAGAELSAREVVRSLEKADSTPEVIESKARAEQQIGRILLARHQPTLASAWLERARQTAGLATERCQHLLIYTYIDIVRAHLLSGAISQAASAAAEGARLADGLFGITHQTRIDAFRVAVSVIKARNSTPELSASVQIGRRNADEITRTQPHHLEAAVQWAMTPLDHGAFDQTRDLFGEWLRNPGIIGAAPAVAWERAGMALGKHAPWSPPDVLRDAARLYGQARQKEPTRGSAWAYELIALAGAGEQEAYEHRRTEGLPNGLLLANIDRALWIVAALLWQAEESRTSAWAVLLPDNTHSEGSDLEPEVSLARALVALRLGKFTEAIQHSQGLAQAQATDGPWVVAALSVEAVAKGKLSRPDFRSALQAAEGIAQNRDPWLLRQATEEWAHWLIARSLLLEARQTLLTDSP